MPFVPVANTVQAEFRELLDGQRVESTMWFRSGDSITESELETLGEVLRDWWSGSILTLKSTELLFREVKLTDMTSNTAPTWTGPVIPNLPGGVGSPAMPNNVSLAISFRTAQRGRAFRGRNYFVGFTEGQCVNSRVNLSVADAIAEAYNSLPGLLPIGWTWVVVSRYIGTTPRSAGIATPVQTAIVVDNIIDSQRRRLPGRGV